MEYIGIEKEAISIVKKRIEELQEAIGIHQPNEIITLDDWIENNELSDLLGLSIRTLQNHRLTGVLGFSVIGRKIYYKRKDVEEFLIQKRIPTKKELQSKKKFK